MPPAASRPSVDAARFKNVKVGIELGTTGNESAVDEVSFATNGDVSAMFEASIPDRTVGAARFPTQSCETLD